MADAHHYAAGPLGMGVARSHVRQTTTVAVVCLGCYLLQRMLAWLLAAATRQQPPRSSRAAARAASPLVLGYE
jgi:hypothetical protein